MAFRNVCFTVNNPCTERIVEWPAYVNYCVYQLEEGENGTKHWQGYAELNKVTTIQALKKWLPTAHFEKRKGTKKQARDYCMKKDETYRDGPWEFGLFDEGDQGKRNDIAEMRDAILDGLSMQDCMDRFPTACARYPRFRDECMQEATKRRITKVCIDEPRAWQVEVLATVNSPVHNRAVYWFYDATGNTGKSHMGRYLFDHYDAFYSNGGKATDIVYAYNGQRIAVFDYVRDSEQFVNYGAIEQIKNGILFSSKYSSIVKRFDTPHVFIFANFFPAKDKMSADRWRIFEIRQNMEALFFL